MGAKASAHLAGFLLACVTLGCGAAVAQPYPNRLVKVITDGAPGAPIDIMAR